MLYDYVAEHGGSIFLNADDEDLVAMAFERNGLEVIEYGIRHWGAMVLPSDAAHPFVRLAIPDSVAEPADAADGTENLLCLETHLAGSYNAANIAAAIAVGLHFGISLEDAIQAVSEYIPKNNRSQLEKTGRNILIEDAYNANPTSMAAALDNLASVQARHKAVMLGDMRELGDESVSEHIAILNKLASMDLDLVCLVGEEFRKALDSEPLFQQVHQPASVTEPAEVTVTGHDTSKIPSPLWFSTSDDLSAWLKENPVSGHTILIKGSRGIRMEKVLPEL